MSKPSTFILREGGRDHRGVFVDHPDGVGTFSVPLREHESRDEDADGTTAVLSLAFGTVSWERYNREDNLTDVRVISIDNARYYSAKECKEGDATLQLHLAIHDNPELAARCAGYYKLNEWMAICRCKDGEVAFREVADGADLYSFADKRSDL